MPDLDHTCGSDLSVTASGDLGTVDGTAFGEQRVIRRLVTNPSAYIWHLDYGGGLPALVGQPTHPGDIESLILAQMLLEQGIAQIPAPTVATTADATGNATVSIVYTDAATGESTTLTI